MRFGDKLKIAGALAAIIPIKYGLYHRWKARREAKLRMKQANRLQFGKLPRRNQRSVLYYRRKQLRDYENIYRRGYQPRMKMYKSERRA